MSSSSRPGRRMSTRSVGGSTPIRLGVRPSRRGGRRSRGSRRSLEPGPSGLGSNDGWLVTPAEIEWALEYRDDDEPLELCDDGADWRLTWFDWLVYLRGAADHGGFRVY
jgi:hypothetical protein